MRKQKKPKHIEMGWLRAEPKPELFSDEYIVLNYDGSQIQQEAFYRIWMGRQGTKEEVFNAFSWYFGNVKDCNLKKDLFFVKHGNEYIATVTAIYHQKNNAGHVHCFAIRDDYRGKRLSYPLMYIAMKKIYDNGADFAYLSTDDWRKPAIKVYINCGFLPMMNEFWPHKKRKMKARWKNIYNELNLDSFKMLNKKYKPIKV